MASKRSKSSSGWSHELHTVKRERNFRQTPADKSPHHMLDQVAKHHIDSFNAIFSDNNGLMPHAVRDIGAKFALDGDPGLSRTPGGAGEQRPPPRNRFGIRVTKVFLERSTLTSTNKFRVNRDVMPAECRERHCSYRGKLTASIETRINDEPWQPRLKDLGFAPIMLRSNKCHLKDMKPAALVRAKEESEELGGYFIVNGNERVVRMLIAMKRNFPLAVVRGSFQNKGKSFSKYGIQFRSARPDETSITSYFHFLNDGNVIFRFYWRKNEYQVPVVMILKALVETNDREIFEGIVGPAKSKGLEQRQFVIDWVEVLLRTYKGSYAAAHNLYTKKSTRAYLGGKFSIVLALSDDVSDEAAGTEFLRKIVLPHLGNVNVTPDQDRDKFKQILFVLRKLYALAEGECAEENVDAVQNQEVLLGGFLYGMIIKERLEEWVVGTCQAAVEWSKSKNWAQFTSQEFKADLSKVLAKADDRIGAGLEYFLSTGNLVSPTGLDAGQQAGFTIVAEKINYLRFISHFRSIHRGAYFAEQKTTTVRKLLPESWGFLCPVHTPDGAPCGLLNHIAHKCIIQCREVDVSGVPDVVKQFGLKDHSSASIDASVVVQLDGRILGYCTPQHAKAISEMLRYLKTKGHKAVPKELEIGYIPNSNRGQYPGIYMASKRSRFIRPVRYLALDKEDFVGPFEQPHMSIACTEPEVIAGESSHVEFDPTNILSILANMTPFSNYNQSPRNMYQCQMAKQTMGTPGTALRYRTDNKSYRLQTGQTPVVRPPLHHEYGFDNFPNGTNAIVAVISYTGYDMDDAMIINKSAHERGFKHGTVYKTKKYNLADEVRNRSKSETSVNSLFGFAPGSVILAEHRKTLDSDGLPIVGVFVKSGDVVAAWHSVTYNASTHSYISRDPKTNFFKYKDDEGAFVEEVRIIGSETGQAPMRILSIKFRIPRSPVIGDKFSSRHGQKGVCSQKWRAVDMPFSESGMQPDVIINPHAFPSRMTIGMFVESLAGKSGALHGMSQDSKPFSFDEENTAVGYFGHQLQKAGYAYHGSEPMYSGITGRELAADIYIGVVYYQRLRHMVGDKFQVRTTGPVNPLTNQPIHGRMRGGGVRVGEMERDALLAHGASFLLQDRLMNCSDRTTAVVCRECGSFLSTTPALPEFSKRAADERARKMLQPQWNNLWRCRRCAKKVEGFDENGIFEGTVWEDGQGGRWHGGADVTQIAVPGVLLYLDVELAAMGVRLKFGIDP